MATEEIEISGLEFAEELASDNLIPVETSTDTKATSLQKIKDWLGSFFISKTGNDSFSGLKTMNSTSFRFGNINLGKYKEIEALAETGTDRVGVLRFTNGSDGVSKEVGISIVGDDNKMRGSLTVGISSAGVPQTKAINPPSNSDSNDIATTKWIKENMATISKATNGYNKFRNGFIIQWGYISLEEKTGTVTFPTPFTSSNYCVVLEAYWDSTGATSSTLTHTTTSFNYKRSRADVSYRWLAVGY